MQESLAPEHGRELLGDALEQVLNGGGVADYGWGHLQSANGDVAELGLDVVRDPLGEVGRISVLEEQGGINYFKNIVGSAISQNTEPRIDYILWIKYFIISPTWISCICSSTSFMDKRPRKMEAAVKYL